MLFERAVGALRSYITHIGMSANHKVCIYTYIYIYGQRWIYRKRKGAEKERKSGWGKRIVKESVREGFLYFFSHRGLRRSSEWRTLLKDHRGKRNFLNRETIFRYISSVLL